MWANKTLDALETALAFVILPVQFVTTLVLGLLVQATFGLLLFPISLVWTVCFVGPLLGLSWLWQRVRFLRLPVALLGLPIALGGSIFVCLMPSMGEMESRIGKLLLCQAWPFTLDALRLTRGQPPSSDAELLSVLNRLGGKDPAMRLYLCVLQEPDPHGITDGRQTALDQFQSIADGLRE